MVINCLLITIGFAAFLTQLQLAYGLNNTAWVITFLGMQNILYFPMNMVFAKMFTFMRFDHVLKIGAVTMLVGCWLRMLSIPSWNFPILMVTQTITILPVPLYFNSISQMV